LKPPQSISKNAADPQLFLAQPRLVPRQGRGGLCGNPRISVRPEGAQGTLGPFRADDEMSGANPRGVAPGWSPTALSAPKDFTRRAAGCVSL